MWQKFTERARRVIILAQEEAGKTGSGHVGTEHLLLGLASKENEGVAFQVLKQAGVTYENTLALIKTEVSSTGKAEEPKLTTKAKRVLEFAAGEARRMHHNYIGTEHLLLALLREQDGQAAKVLQALGLSLETLRQEVMTYLGDSTETSFHASTETFELSDVEKLQMEREFLNAAKIWAINENDYELAALLRDAVEKVERRIEVVREEQDTQNEEPKGA